MRQRGFTLVEAILVIVIMGVMVAVAMPRLQQATIKQSLRGSRNTLVGLYSQTRITAMQRGRPAELHFEGNRAFIIAEPRTLAGVGTHDTIGAVRDLYDEFGVTLLSDQNTIVVNAKGLAQAGSEIKVKTMRGSYADSVLIGWYGRLRK